MRRSIFLLLWAVIILLLYYSLTIMHDCYDKVGIASYYGERFHGRKTASGQVYNMYEMTAAHRILPFGTKLKVTNIKNNREVIVTVNDRGPFKRGRIIDLSKAAARKIGMLRDGITKVKIEILSP